MKVLFRILNSMNSQNNWGYRVNNPMVARLTLRVTHRDLDRRAATAVGGQLRSRTTPRRRRGRPGTRRFPAVAPCQGGKCYHGLVAVLRKCRLAGHSRLWVVSDSKTIGRARWPRKRRRL